MRRQGRLSTRQREEQHVPPVRALLRLRCCTNTWQQQPQQQPAVLTHSAASTVKIRAIRMHCCHQSQEAPEAAMLQLVLFSLLAYQEQARKLLSSCPVLVA
eukprot:GHRQ01016367.1.p5 GENE.GHRQ01016367.1~~GHRQ01016367.1.p5  ORF type:complete len:101 (+),score=33.55 GHRQ01016367.1:1077-1379(+)